jgi:beta-carotene 3-hydroxylase
MKRIITFTLSALLMEPVSAAIHRYVGHGPGWTIHRSHHEGTVAGIEANDTIPAMSAVATIGLFVAAVTSPSRRWLFPVASGITAYGAAYFVVHDVYIHRRIPVLPRHVPVLERFRVAHLEHHRLQRDHWGIFWS